MHIRFIGIHMKDPREQLIDIAYGYFLPNALHAIARLNIADQLVDGAKTADEIADQLKFDAPSLHRVMLLLTQYNIFTMDKDNRFSLNQLSELLLSQGKESIKDLMVFVHDIFNQSSIALEHTIKTGEPGCKKVFGQDFFSLLSSDKTLYDRFDKGMANYSANEENILSQAFSFSEFDTIIDVGGGQGGLLSQLLKKHPNPQGILADKANDIENPKYIIENKVQSRCQIVACDFFKSVPKKGNLYLMKRIIHDWDNEKSLLILNNVANAIPNQSKLLIMDSVINQDTPRFKYVEDVLIMSVLHGRERTEKEFRDLIQQSPFKIEKIVNTKALLNIIVCEKK